jgi:hypothetical protein
MQTINHFGLTRVLVALKTVNGKSATTGSLRLAQALLSGWGEAGIGFASYRRLGLDVALA